MQYCFWFGPVCDHKERVMAVAVPYPKYHEILLYGYQQQQARRCCRGVLLESFVEEVYYEFQLERCSLGIFYFL